MNLRFATPMTMAARFVIGPDAANALEGTPA
jgi:hypothetical protein